LRHNLLHAGNAFTLLLRHVTSSPPRVSRALTRLGSRGFVNYFGHQRFGDGGGRYSRSSSWLYEV
jgi:tRNA(Glu) U13 pseudouridine synthase TruD